jgi:uridylate kinase
MTALKPYLSGPGVVVKVGGNVLMPRGAVRPDTTAVEGIASFVRHAQDGGNRKVVIVPGGFAGQIVVEWARELGASDLLLNDLGCTLIDVAARILADALSRRLSADGLSVSPEVAGSFETLGALCRHNVVTVAGVLGPGALTSDSLAIMIASALGWPIVLVKLGEPFQTSGLKTAMSDGVPSLSASELLKVLSPQHGDMRPGNHPSLDIWALELLRRDKQTAYLTTRDGMVSLGGKRTLEPLIAVQG